MEVSKNWLNYLGIALLVILVFVGGFYYGFRYHEANSGVTNSAQIQGVAESIVRSEVVAKEVDGVYWLKPNEDPGCPVDYPIKAKFDSGVCFFYTKDNQSYGRVKANLCFATEDFAQNSAGCLKKF